MDGTINCTLKGESAFDVIRNWILHASDVAMRNEISADCSANKYISLYKNTIKIS